MTDQRACWACDGHGTVWAHRLDPLEYDIGDVAECACCAGTGKIPVAPALKPGWTLGDPPTCADCGEVSPGPVAILDGASWMQGWNCDSCGWCAGDDGQEIFIEWPFVQGYASGDDFRAIGFGVE